MPTVQPARPACRAATAAVALALPLLAWPLHAAAQTASPSPSASPAAPASSTRPADVATGEVRKIEPERLRLTLNHGEIKSLEMHAMTMPFRVASPDLLKGLKVGDPVRFRAEKVGHEAVVTWLEVAR
jgi:Cu/Ag efflux protein CusF